MRLSLVMIVRNEANGIEATLRSVLGYVDRWLIVDTGSQDGTQDLVRQTMAGVPGSLVEEPFVDFATTRNRALSLVDPRVPFTLMLSGDETLSSAEGLRSFCEAHVGEPDAAFYVRVRTDTLDYDSIRLTRTGSPWGYRGATHEQVFHPAGVLPTQRVPDLIVQNAWRFGPGSFARWNEDLTLLDAALERDPNDTRATFYHAQTLACFGMFTKAIAEYRRYLGIISPTDDAYEPTFRIAQLLEQSGAPWAETQAAYLRASALEPHRAEPFYAIAKRLLRDGDYTTAYELASRAASLPRPEQLRAFVRHEAYARSRDMAAAARKYAEEKD